MTYFFSFPPPFTAQKAPQLDRAIYSWSIHLMSLASPPTPLDHWHVVKWHRYPLRSPCCPFPPSPQINQPFSKSRTNKQVKRRTLELHWMNNIDDSQVDSTSYTHLSYISRVFIPQNQFTYDQIQHPLKLKCGGPPPRFALLFPNFFCPRIVCSPILWPTPNYNNVIALKRNTT